MMTLKQFFFSASLFWVLICFSSCSNTEDAVLEKQNSQQTLEKVQEAEIQELITFIEMLNANQVQTRGRFWDRIKLFFIGDAWGWGYGVEYTSSSMGGLISAIVFSIVFATFSDSLPSQWWRLNSDWKVYNSPLRDYEIIGNNHNKATYDLMTTDNSIANGTFSNDYLYNSTNKKLKSYGYGYEMSLLEKSRLMLMMDNLKTCTTVEQFRTLMQRECPQRMSEFELVENYVDGLINKNDKATVRSYTKQVYAQIDASSLTASAISRLKTMIAVAENSKFLWLEIE